MPAPKPQDARRGQLLHGLQWAGVGLAPIAVLVLLFGSSTGALRVAVILATLTVAMVAVSVALRPSDELMRVDIEQRVLDQVDHIRARAREDVTTAARNTHRALTEQIRELGETVEDMRNQIIEMQATSMLAEPHSISGGGHGPGGPGVVRRTETVHVTRRTTMVGAGEDERPGTVYGSPAVISAKPAGAVEGEWRERGEDHRWDGMAAGDRWATVRADDGARELRVGERRSATRRDDHGAEYHVEDHWAALRREEDRGRDRRDPDRRDLDRRDPDRRDSGPRDSDRGRGYDPGYGEADWEATFKSLSSQPAQPAITSGRPRDQRDEWDDQDWITLSRSNDREPDRHRGDDRGRDVERDRGPEPYRAPEPYRDAGHDRDRSGDRGRERDADWDRPRHGGRDRFDDRERDRDRYDDRGRDDRDRYDDRARDDRGRDDRARDDRGRDDRDRYDDRARDDRDRYDDRARDDRARDDRARDDRARDDRARDDRGWDDRGRGEWGRDDRDYPSRQRGPHR